MTKSLIEENKRLKRELEETRAVLADKLETESGKPIDHEVWKWVRNPEAVRTLLKLEPHPRVDGDYEEVGQTECVGCLELGRHSIEPLCPIIAAWDALGDPRAQQAIDDAFREFCERQQYDEEREARRLEREAVARNPCQKKNDRGRECRLGVNHEGACAFARGLEDFNDTVKQAYADLARDAGFFGIDRSVDAHRCGKRVGETGSLCSKSAGHIGRCT